MKGRTIQRMTTGVLSYDAALGGGWPIGHHSEVIGNESHGKTLLAQETVVANQRLDPKFSTLWLAGEPVNFEWCETLGMDLDRVQFVPATTWSRATRSPWSSWRTDSVDLVVIDSLPAMIPTSEDDRDFDELTIGKAALLNNKYFVRKSPIAMKRSLTAKDRPCTGLVVNQWRERIGVTHGDPRIAPGGKGKNFAFFVRVEMTPHRVDQGRQPHRRWALPPAHDQEQDAPVNRSAEINFYFDSVAGFTPGTFDHVEDIVNTGLYYDLFGAGGGGYYTFGEQRLAGQGQAVRLRCVRISICRPRSRAP